MDSAQDVWIETPDALWHGCVEGREDGPWLTCLHSLASNLHLWDSQAQALGSQFRLLRLDLPGHGRSEAHRQDMSIASLRDGVLACWDFLGLQSSAVLGLSLGGMLALDLALHSPERVSRLVAADCRADAPASFRAMWEERQRVLAEGGMPAIVEVTLPTWLTPDTLACDGPEVRTVTQMIMSTSEAGYLAATGALQQLNLLPCLAQLQRPVLYLVGAEDGVHPEAMRAMHERTPGSCFRVLPDAAHLSNLEQPDLFSALALAFLRGEPLPELS